MVSLVVPIRDEPEGWEDNFRPVASDFEIVVVDGSSRPKASRLPGRVLALPGVSRGARLHAGALAARSDVLFFLHGDSRPPSDARARIEAALTRGAGAGSFRLAYRDSTAALRWIAGSANVRTRFLRLPFGDQGIFCTRAAYEAAGGFRDLPICDDLDFVLRLRRTPGFTTLDGACLASPRRYGARPFRQVWRNARVLAGFLMGIPPERLEAWYGVSRDARPSRE
jgi:hypothetical protein